MLPSEINKVLQVPEWDKASPIKTNEAEFLFNFVSQNKISKTLETGFAFAKSASHIMAATNSRHVAIDPFQDRYQNFGLANIDRLGMKANLEFYPDYSHNVLPKLLNEGRQFEFIFIDGDHKFDGILVDFYYADLLLQKQGYVLLHDTWMRSTRLVESFIQTNRDDYKFIKTPLRNFSLFQKIGNDKRDGMYFREYYNTKSIVVHSLINWMSNGKENFAKKTLRKIKDIVK